MASNATTTNLANLNHPKFPEPNGLLPIQAE